MKNIVAALFLAIMTCAAQEQQITELKSPSMEAAAPTQAAASTDEQKSASTIFGTVIDQATHEPIARAMITILGTKLAGQSSVDGQYKIESIPEGIFQIKAEAEGYEPQIMNNVPFDGQRSKERLFFTLRKSQEPPPDFIPVQKQPTPLEGFTPAPAYPDWARRKHLEGTVWVKIWIDEQGNAHQAKVIKSDQEIFNAPSTDAAMRWKFEPAILNDKPVAVWVSIPFKFKLSKDGGHNAASTKPKPKPQKKDHNP
jgi:TonB family protein